MQAPNARSKRHVEIALPEGMRYRAGDYLSLEDTPKKNLIHGAAAGCVYLTATHVPAGSAAD